ncbi:uncharacterized protein LOC126680355 [Mercurialis annua]|uniref:uncharacterized protein LOC126680355 n=1 Tax=Mercurialis annua TaxID=3986 RepID=UPI00215FFDD0|nr:uncharacterized protein LOC126680355 [Mercurialis annua]XP_050231432.1 uncharacterized protein LOC126680355 [Mercurialis annua]
MDPDRSWMYRRLTGGLLHPGFYEHVEEFVNFALRHPGCMSGGVQIKCPCSQKKCRNTSYRDVETVKLHILKKGFVQGYHVWVFHGEGTVLNPLPIAQLPKNEFDSKNEGGKFSFVQKVIIDTAGPEVVLTDDVKKKSEIALANQMSEPTGPGSDPVSHTGGSRSAVKHMDVMAKVLGSKPTAPELSNRLHSTKADKRVLLDKRAHDMSDAVAHRLVAASQSTTGDGNSSSPADVDETRVLLDIEGVNKKQRLHGLGSATSKYFDEATSSRARGSSSQSQRADDDFERRVQAGVQEGLRQATADFKVRVAEFGRQQLASNNERMTTLIRAEIAKMMPNLPPEYHP